MTRKAKIEFLVDGQGRKKSVLMSYRTYLQLLEDIADLQSIAERKGEERFDLESVIADLKNAGRV